jgi:hypothetical protein
MESEPSRSRTKPAWAQLLVTLAAILVFAGVYVGLMWLAVDSTRITDDHTVEDRDMLQLAIHGGIAAGATLAGFLIGKWLNGLGLAYAVLVGGTVVVLMVAALAGSQTLACEADRNDVIRHWTC